MKTLTFVSLILVGLFILSALFLTQKTVGVNLVSMGKLPTTFMHTNTACTNLSITDAGNFASPQFAFEDDGFNSAATITTTNTAFCTQWGGFGFNLNTSTIITDVWIEILGRAVETTAHHWRASIRFPGSVCTSTERGTGSGTLNSGTSFALFTFGFAFVTTGCTFTPSSFNNDAINVTMIARTSTSATRNYVMDYFKIWIQYELMGGAGSQGPPGPPGIDGDPRSVWFLFILILVAGVSIAALLLPRRGL